MSRVKVPPPAFVKKFRKALLEDLERAGIRATVKTESLPPTKLHRFVVLSKDFDALGHSERQDLAWRIADHVLSREEKMLVSMILTLTPAEVSGV